MDSERSSPMAGTAFLQRSGETFRRSGSSGLVWENRLAVSKDSTQAKEAEEFRNRRHSYTFGSTGTLERNRSTSTGGGGRQSITAGTVLPALDPPSPKVSGCGFCGIFGSPTPPTLSNVRRH